MRTENICPLQDNRDLGYAEYGLPNGRPVFYFHGGQESRLSSTFMDPEANRQGLRIISPDRPGVGLSSFQENRRFIDWATDVSQLADYLGIDQFSVLGLSGGAPHLLACLSAIPDRIQHSSIVAGATPYDYKGSLKGMWFPVKLVHWFATRKNDRLLRKFLSNDQKALEEEPEKRIKQFQKHLPRPDRDLLTSQPEYAHEFVRGSLESYRQGIDGVVQEWKLYVNDWGFDWKSTTTDVSLWFGKSDNLAPPSRGEHYHRNLVNSRLYLIENEGHFSLIRNRLPQILSELKGGDQ